MYEITYEARTCCGRRGTSQKMCEFRKNSGPLFFLCLIISKTVMLKV